MSIGVVVPVLNQFKSAVDALASVKTKQSWQPYILDNYRSPRSVAASWNIGAEAAVKDGHDYILIINDDILLSPYTIDHMVELMYARPEIAVLTGSDIRNFMGPEDVLTLGPQTHEIDIIDAPDFACFMITPESYNNIGRFDENFYPAYFEDNDYVYRTLLANRLPVRSQNSPFYHYGSRTQNAGGAPVVPSDQFVKNRQYFSEKWGGQPGKETYRHPYNDANYDWRYSR